MKRLLLLIGIMTTVLTGTSKAHATGTPVSPAVATLLQRAEAVLAVADTAPRPDSTYSLPTAVADWSRFALASVIREADTKVQVLERQRALFRRTSCWQTDIVLVDDLLKRIRVRLSRALTERSISDITRLSDLYEFTADQAFLLFSGGLDPSVRDSDFYKTRLFETTQPQGSGDFCYYHSDYSAPSLLLPGRDGYGCDLQVMEQKIIPWLMATNDYPVLRAEVEREYASLRIEQMTADQYATTTQSMADLQRYADAIASGQEPPVPEEPPPRRHLEEQGCVPSVSSDVALESLRGPLSVEPDHQALTYAFRRLRVHQDQTRPIVGIGDSEQGGIAEGLTMLFKRALSQFTRRQAQRDAVSFIASGDAVLSIEDAVHDWRTSLTTLTRLASSMDGGLRSFTRDFASYLLRSCLARPCQERLTRILKIVFTDACFPYAKGEFFSGVGWEACAVGAGL